MMAVKVLAAIASLLLLVLTVLPLSRSKAWWVRIWDFPRVQISVGLAAVLGLVAMVGPGRLLLLPVLALALGYQLWRIRPYSPLVTKEIGMAPPDPAQDLRVMAANVLMENDRHAGMCALVEAVDPDVLLLMETDAAWVAALEPALARYPTVIRVPQENYYGLVFATRLETVEARAVRLSTDDTPSVFAELVDRQGRTFRFVGLHPRPPTPGEDTDERDAQILYSARFAAQSGMPLVAMGDFNDAAWSDTAQRFKTVGGYLDPRIGRGLFSSFDARRWWFRCPIDQIYVTPDVAMVDFHRGAATGSDHFPMIATIRLDAGVAARLNRAPRELSGSDAEAVEAGVAAWRERLGPEAFPVPGARAEK